MAIKFNDVIKLSKNKLFEKTPYSSNDLLNEFESSKKAGLLIGQVQSGKTNTIIEIIKEALRVFNYDLIFLLGGTNNLLLDQTKKRLEDNNIITSDINIDSYSTSQKVYCLLKQKDHLQKMYEKIDCYSSNKKILIIDDECDYASINTSTSDNSENSTIFEQIRKSWSYINQGGIIFVSATPFSNILKTFKDIKIDFSYSLPLNYEYTGNDFFLKQKDFYINENIFNNINLDSDDNQTQNLDIDRQKLKKIIYFWLLKTFLLFKKTNNNKSDLIIYLSDSLDFNKSIKDFLKSFNPKFNELLKVSEYFKFNISEHDMRNFLSRYWNNTKVLLLISENDKESNFNEYEQTVDKEGIRIIVGGVFLSRGFTYNNLTTEYFTYCSKNPTADTLLQRCRWFGYRRKDNKYKYMNVITTLDIFYALESINHLISKISHPLGAKFNMNELYNYINEWNEENKYIVEATSRVKK